MIVSLRCDCAFFLEKLEIIMCRLWRPECVARHRGNGYLSGSRGGLVHQGRGYCPEKRGCHESADTEERRSPCKIAAK